jgi:hypothetical protein
MISPLLSIEQVFQRRPPLEPPLERAQATRRTAARPGAASTRDEITAPGRTLQSISCVVPCHNEARNLERLLPQLKDTLSACALMRELILVDDGSTDATGLPPVSRTDPMTRCVQEIGMTRSRRSFTDEFKREAVRL